MIDPFNPIKFDRTDQQLEEWLLFCILVAGKGAIRAAKVANQLATFQPLTIQRMDELESVLRVIKTGQYGRIGRAIYEAGKLDLRTCSVADMELVHGIGPKTARMFIAFSRPNQRVAILDTHLLKYLRAQGIDAPKTTPSGKQYLRLEKAYLDICGTKGLDPAQHDLSIWTNYAGGSNGQAQKA